MRKFQFKIDYLVDIILKKKLRLVTQIQIGATKNIQIQFLNKIFKPDIVEGGEPIFYFVCSQNQLNFAEMKCCKDINLFSSKPS